MSEIDSAGMNDRQIRSLREKKNKADPSRPYSWSVEKERTREGKIEDTGTIFLTNKECPFTCLMCDLWMNTTDNSVSAGDIESQLNHVLPEFKSVPNLKLYNSGNFFDGKAIPENAIEMIAGKLGNFKTLIVENHPNFINDRCLKFRDMISGELQVAIGLETVHPEILPRLNKKMDLADFEKAVRFLGGYHIPVRAFILLGLPYIDEKESIFWAKRSIDFAFQCGVECCSIIPLRTGNGAMNLLQDRGLFHQPSIASLEEAGEYGISLGSGRVFMDTWDLEDFSKCDECLPQRKERLHRMNLYQSIPGKIKCNCQRNR